MFGKCINSNLNNPNKLEWTFESSNMNNYTNLTIVFTYLDNSEDSVNLTVQNGSGSIDLSSFTIGESTFGINRTIARVTITDFVFYNYWWSNNSSDSDIYIHTFSNSYPYEPVLSNKEFYFEPVNINMMFDGDNGTISSPFLIKNEWQLNNIRYCDSEYRDDTGVIHYLQSFFAILNNIELEQPWSPIDVPLKSGKIFGYNNQSVIIKGLRIVEDKSNKNIGFIRTVYGGTIEYLTFDEVSIVVNNSSNLHNIGIGTIVGNAIGGGIINCNITSGTIKVGDLADSNSLTGAKYTFTGGICGIGMSIVNCNCIIDITSFGDIGGIVGYILGGNINNCYHSGYVKLIHNNVYLSLDQDNKCVGGIIGRAIDVTLYSVTVNTRIIYYSNSMNNDNNLSPRMGGIAGYIFNSTIEYADFNGMSFSLNNLSEKKNLFGITIYNQKKYTGNAYGLVEQQS